MGRRIGKYIGIAAQGWMMTAATLAIVWCLVLRNPGDTLAAGLSDMGLHWRLPQTDAAVWSVAMIAAAVLASYAVTFLRKALGGSPTAAGHDIIPETPAETAVFFLIVAPSAGVGEEVVFRGFLLSQLWGYSGSPWIAALVSSALFGLMHRYQGWWGVARTGVIGFVFAVGVIMTGSLIPSIIAHTLANMIGVIFSNPALRQPAAS
jgi:membrane protease YdiL (CAAX protease family)